MSIYGCKGARLALRLALLLGLSGALWACGGGCTRNTDCHSDSTCQAGACVLLPGPDAGPDAGGTGESTTKDAGTPNPPDAALDAG